jgi:isoquinoline 1-oxidoreductase alpha subunit
MITLTVNGTQHSVNVDPTTPLLWVLRDALGLTGTKFGCGIEVCGACTVLLNGSAERSCDIQVKNAVGKHITTIEGMAATALGKKIQAAWVAEQVPQCGYCQSGMIMAVAELLQGGGKPSDAAINSQIDNICVCGTFQRIRAAIHLAAGN